MKSPNSEPESIYLAMLTQMHVNRSHWFNLFMLMFMFPKGQVFKGSIDKGLPCAISLCYTCVVQQQYSAQYLRALTKEARPCPQPYYPTTQVLESIFLSVVLGDTIAVRWPSGLSKEGFRKSMLICIQVLFDALPLEGVPTGVTRVANRCALKNHLYFLRV